MKYFCFISLLFFAGCDFNEVSSKIENQQEVLIPDNTIKLPNPDFIRKGAHATYKGIPYSGFVEAFYETGKLKLHQSFYEGRKEGIYKTWHPDGSQKEIRHFTNNRKDDIHRGWWPNGKKKFEYIFDNGVYHGDAKEWYENGDLLKHFFYENGQEIGAQKMWREDGKLRANYVVKKGKRYGLIGSKPCYSVKNENKNEE